MIMKNESKTKMISLMALLIFGAFALCALLVLLTGADIYKKITLTKGDFFVLFRYRENSRDTSKNVSLSFFGVLSSF